MYYLVSLAAVEYYWECKEVRHPTIGSFIIYSTAPSPEWCINYIICHKLCQQAPKNHGYKFFNLLKCPDYKMRKIELELKILANSPLIFSLTSLPIRSVNVCTKPSYRRAL